MSGIANEIAGLTPKQRALLELRLRRKQSGAGGGSIPRRAAGGDPLPLSFAQQRLWFIDQLQPGSVFFNISTALRLSGALDAAAFAGALAEVVRRHEVLRTTFRAVEGQPFQIIGEATDFPLGTVDLSGLGEREREGRLRELLAGEEREPFDLSLGPLLRARLVRLGATEHAVLFTIHHIVCDGLSMDILVREVAALYEAFSAGRPSPLAELPVQYADYSVWQRELLRGEELERHLAYWRAQLAGAPPLLELPSARMRPARQTFRGATITQQLPPALSAAVKEFSRREGVTPFVTLLAAFKALLFRHTGREDMVVGSPMANRGRVELEGLIGFFANPLVLRTRLAGDPTFRELARRVSEATLGAHAHQEIPFQKLVDELRLKRDLTYHPLFQISFTLDNPKPTPARPRESQGLGISPLEMPAETVQHDLTLHMADTGAGLVAFWQYSTDLYDAATVEQLTDEFQLLLAHVERAADARLSELTGLLVGRERERRGERAAQAAEASLQRLKLARRRAVGVSAGVNSPAGGNGGKQTMSQGNGATMAERDVATAGDAVVAAGGEVVAAGNDAGDGVGPAVGEVVAAVPAAGGASHAGRGAPAQIPSRRRAVGATPGGLVKTSQLPSGGALPLVVEPAVRGVSLSAWAGAGRELVESMLARHGGILFRNFDVRTAPAFEQFIRAVAGEPAEYRERSSPRSNVGGNIYTSTDHPAAESIFLHNENSYQQAWPLKIFFFCETPAAERGETPIADVRRVFARIAPEIRERFARKKWMYVRNFGDGLGLPWQTVFQTDDRAAVEEQCRARGIEVEWKEGGRLRTRAVREAIARHPRTGELVWFNHATFFHVSTLGASLRDALLQEFAAEDLPTNTFYGDGSPIEPETLDALRRAYELETVSFPWRRGDVLLLDNMLAAHGRAPYAGERKILVGMAEPWSDRGI